MVTCLKIPDRAPPPPIFIYYTLWIPEYQNPILENSLMNFSPRPFIYKHSPFHSLSTQQEQTSQTLASALVCFLAEIQMTSLQAPTSPLSPHCSLEKIIFHEVMKLLIKLLIMFFTMIVPLYECGCDHIIKKITCLKFLTRDSALHVAGVFAST